MNNPIEFEGSSDPRQHLIDLGADPGIVDLNLFVLQRIETAEDIGRVIRRSPSINTSLGGTQITSKVMSVLYTDDPAIRDECRKQIRTSHQLPDEAIDAYFQSTQYGMDDLRLNFGDVANTLGDTTEFIRTADSITVSLLRSYFGFFGKYAPDKHEVDEEYDYMIGNIHKTLDYPLPLLKMLISGSRFLDPTTFAGDLKYFREHKEDTTEGEGILQQLIQLNEESNKS